MTLKHRLNKIQFESGRLAETKGTKVVHKTLMNALEKHKSGDHNGAIAIIENVDNWSRNALAQRFYGHALHGNKEYSKAALSHIAARQLNEGNAFDVAHDEINLAAVQISMKDYKAAWETYGRVHDLIKNDTEVRNRVWIGKICILNRREQRDELNRYLLEIFEKDTEFFRDPMLLRHLNEDSDFMGVRQMIIDLLGTEILGDENV